MREGDGLIRFQIREGGLKEFSILLMRVEPTEDDVADRFVARLFGALISHRRRQRHSGRAMRRMIKLGEVDHRFRRFIRTASAIGEIFRVL